MTSGMVDLVIRDVLLVSPEASRPGAVAVEGGRIVAIGRSDAMPGARRVIEGGGRPLIPARSTCMSMSAIRVSRTRRPGPARRRPPRSAA